MPGHDETLHIVKKLAKPFVIGLAVLILGIVLLAADVARFSGAFHAFDAGFAGACSAVPLGGSSMDVQIDRKRGLAYLSVLDHVSNAEAPTGSVLLLDLNVSEPAARAAMAYDPADFRPQGLSLLSPGNGPALLFAISYPADGDDAVEIAEWGPGGEFVPKETLRNPAFVHPLAIAAVGGRQFYLANDSGTQGRFARAFDLVLRRGRATLVYYDGKDARIVERGLRFPAGLALSPDASRLYVGEALGKQLRIYRREPATGALTLEEKVPLGAAPDNLDVDADGVVWIAAHPKLFALFTHLRKPEKRAPTQVLRFDPRQARPTAGGDDPRLSQVYGDEGAQISAGSVAAHWRDEFIVGARLDHKVLICKPNP